MIIQIQLFGGGGGTSWGRNYFNEITHPVARSKGHREYKSKDNNFKYRYDPKRGKDPEHYHIYNPNGKSNDDMYLDKDGNPAARHSEEAALSKEEFERLINELIRRNSKWK